MRKTADHLSIQHRATLSVTSTYRSRAIGLLKSGTLESIIKRTHMYQLGRILAVRIAGNLRFWTHWTQKMDKMN